MTRADYQHYDYIVAMDHNNLRNIRRLIGDDTDHKITLLMNFSDCPRDVADPWYTGDFEATWKDVWEGCNALLHAVISHN